MADEKLELKACPFCGGEAAIEDGGFNHWRVSCTVCGATCGRQHKTSGTDVVREKWNTRTPAIGAEALEKVREAIADVIDFGDESLNYKRMFGVGINVSESRLKKWERILALFPDKIKGASDGM